MPKQNTLQFNVQDLPQANWQLRTKSRSLTFGRRLYQIQVQHKLYWLKVQYKEEHPSVEQHYLREVEFYRGNSHLNCLLPIQYVDLTQQLEFKQTYTSFMLPHATPWLVPVEDLTVTEIKIKILSMLNCMEELAQHGFIHADLKHEHFVQWQGHLKLLDFEHIQAIAMPDQKLSATPRYMAPELFHTEAKSIQTDLYALGIILYEWLSGQRLSASSYTDWAYLHCQHLRIELPQAYQCFLEPILGLTAKLKAARFADIKTVKQAIEQIKC